MGGTRRGNNIPNARLAACLGSIAEATLDDADCCKQGNLQINEIDFSA